MPDEPSVAHWRQCTSDGHGWPSVPVAHENTVFARITLLADTVFARISLLAGRREGTLYTTPVWGRLNGSLLSCLRKDVALV
ncbi:hypothetical protein [Desulfosporosinus sp.]|uniref:hypothetical protein n=1 Tax=Desulfosporosinus sp. TaxID=157907 RepID=UPI0025C2252E|nr:hypothetical protein [Desulfosporosinus sp.]MBC2721051.1 hypothetical protein [Desulfosporosinus sp.]MBC2725627.1 hypothetical protein [Desulfosporosinus sp.]